MMLSGEKDIDYSIAVTELSKEALALEALQASFAKISQLSLFDYIR
jgi:flagellar hook-associated protein 3 FlgL